MVELLVIVVSIGLADCVNPGTVGPALYLATTQRAIRQLAGFAAGVFAVNLAGGLLIVLGPGRLLLSLVPEPSAAAAHVVEVVAGAAVLALAAIVWLRRERLASRGIPGGEGGRGSGFALGAAITAVELPTAFPYFAVIATTVASGVALPAQIAALAVFNLVFVAPVLAIICVLAVAGDRAEPALVRARDWLQRNWPVLLAALGLLIGVGLVVYGAAGLVAS
jgi:cytochrome c biogenesis protein CcdA